LDPKQASASRRYGCRQRPQFCYQPQDVGKQISQDGDLGHLECDVAAMADDFRADFDELPFQGRQRPVLDRVRRRQGSQEVTEIVSKRMKLKTNRVGGERAA